MNQETKTKTSIYRHVAIDGQMLVRKAGADPIDLRPYLLPWKDERWILVSLVYEMGPGKKNGVGEEELGCV